LGLFEELEEQHELEERQVSKLVIGKYILKIRFYFETHIWT
jgi:hypothetical protein